MCASPPKKLETDIFAIPLNGQHVVYAPLRRIAFIANAALVNFLWEMRAGQAEGTTTETAEFLKFFDDIGLTGDRRDFPVASLAHDVFKPTHITLFLTNRCNLHCPYCYASANTGFPVDMDFLTAKQGVDYICQNAVELGAKQFEVGFHGGGEPTLNWTVLTKTLQYSQDLAQRNGLKVNATLATNGVFSTDKCRWIVENLNGVSLSLDGAPSVQNVNRPFANGRPSANMVFQTLQIFDENHFPYGIRMTVTDRSVKKLPASVRYVLKRSKPGRIQVEPVYLLGRGKDGVRAEPQAFTAAFQEASQVAAEYGVELFYSCARVNVLTDRFCRSCAEGFSLTPKGKVSACYEICDEKTLFAEKFIFGGYDKSLKQFVFNHEKLAELRRINVDNNPRCRGCFCKWHCAGDCPNKIYHAALSGESTDSYRCEITQTLVLNQILNKIEQNGGLFWAEGISDTQTR